MSRRFLLFLLPLLSLNRVFSQDAFFTNVGQSLIYLNPSFSGTNGFIRSQSIYRLQDFNGRVPFKTAYTSLDAYVRPLNGGIAFSYLNDIQGKGTLRTNAAGFAYAQHIFANKKTIRIIPAVQAVYSMNTTNLEDKKFRDTIEYRKNYTIEPVGLFPETETTRSYLDVNGSVLIQTRKLNCGVGLFHLNQPNEGSLSVKKLPLKINLHGSYNFSLTEDMTLSVFALFISQGDFKDYFLNCNLSLNKELFLSVGMRKANALTASVAFQSDAFRLGIGFDYGLNSDLPAIYGKSTIEIMLSFNFINKKAENGETADWLTW
jgi:type IX secretion system PorP/SprF family membrane protein